MTAQPPALAIQPRRRGGRRTGASWWAPWAFIAPNLVGLVAFTLIPLVSGLLIAFTDWNVISGLQGLRWVGLENFGRLLRDEKFWAAAGRTVAYGGVSVPFTLLLGLALAVALNRPLPGRAALRIIFFLPAVVNTIAIGMVWLLLLNPQSGLLNAALRLLGWTNPPGWFVSSHWALAALILVAIWGGAGYLSVIYLAALQDMPPDLYEAAALDGAGAWRKFRTITWPLLMPTTTYLAITSFIGASQGFGLIAFITQGGPGESTTVLSYYMYQSGFLYYRFGYAAAIGIMSFLGVLAMTLLLWRLQRGRGLYT